MNIQELDKYDLADAVKFHDHLNPRIWGEDQHLLPQVQQKLRAVAADFQEFLGVPDLKVKDITISGSNAAYSYTPDSDIDLHLVVDMPQDPVYQELFNAKKYQYNDQYDIRIGGADVELYVQPADQPHISQGVYSVLNQDWISVPSRKRAQIDHSCVQAKTADLEQRIRAAVASQDREHLENLAAKIKAMRKTGLAQHGEFGCENLVFKMLRRSGALAQLSQARGDIHDRELSLMEKKRKKTRWSWGGYWVQPEADTGGGDGGGVEESITPDTIHQLADRKGIKWDNEPSFLRLTKRLTGREHLDDLDQKQLLKVKQHLEQQAVAESPNGVSPETKMFLSEQPDTEILKSFIRWTRRRLGIRRMPRVLLHVNKRWSEQNHSFGRFDPETGTLHVSLPDRHILDVMRTTAHELAHCRQHEVESLPNAAGETGSDWENEAHAVAGIIMRDYADAHPDLFRDSVAGEIEESASGYIPTKKQARDPRWSMALTQDIRPGEVGRQANKLALKTDRQGRPALLMKTANLREGRQPQPSQGPGRYRDLNQPLGPETPPTMPAGTVRVDVSDVYDWYKLGQHIANLRGLGHHDFGKGPPSTIVSFGDEETEHRYIQDLEKTGLSTTDIDPRDPNQPPGMKPQKTDPTYNVAEDDVLESLRREFALLEDELLSELRMSPSSLRAEAAKTGAQAGMEFEMIIPGVGGVGEDQEMERDYNMDRRIRGIQDIRDFFYDGEYNTRHEAERLTDRIWEDYMDSQWLGERKKEEWSNSAAGAIRDWVEENERDDLGAQAAEEVQQQSDDPNWNLDNPDFRAQVERRTEELMDQRTDDIEANMGPEYDEVFEIWEENDWMDQWNDDDWFTDWLDSEGYSVMSDLESSYDITWPYWTQNEDAELNIQSVADDFSGAIDRPVRASSGYHEARRDKTSYIVEPDGSLDPDDSDDAGLEFVSPPLPIDDLLSDLNKVKTWADSRGAYTNKSTGLHINVSVPGLDTSELDYVKLALLLGDEYVLNQFGRIANIYTRSAMGKIRERASQRPEDVQHYMDLMRQGLAKEASRMVHAPRTDKYTSINVKQGYVEFRSPGGDWLKEDLAKIENTLMRFVVALSAAADPEKDRKEYLKKLYQVLAPKNDQDPVSIFARYSAGELPQSALKSFIRQLQLQRQVKKQAGGGEKYWWEVMLNGAGQDGPGMEVVATSEQEALAIAAKAWEKTAVEMARATARPIRPAEAAVGQAGPRRSQTQAATQNVVNPLWQEPEQASQPQSQPQSAGENWTGRWQVIDVYGGNRVLYTFGGIGNDRQAAARIGSEWARNNGVTQIIDVRPEMN